MGAAALVLLPSFFGSLCTSHLASWLFLNLSLQPPGLGPLHRLFLLPGMLFPQIHTWLTPWLPSGCLNVSFSARPVINTLFQNCSPFCVPPHPSHRYAPCVIPLLTSCNRRRGIVRLIPRECKFGEGRDLGSFLVVVESPVPETVLARSRNSINICRMSKCSSVEYGQSLKMI